jgi:hypothetical protein
MLHVCFRGFRRMMRGVFVVSSRGVCMMRGRFMRARFVMLRSLVMMPRCLFQVFRGMAMMGGSFLGHVQLLR